ncbi:hypothetical protein GALL_442460 [mine drainage metagenome]|uniref:Uncharacterized protein n=1 Tax=mine drainage metagenome TaxID=410659 RepID=A0A1J5Q292_9ZZZZ
MDDAVIHRPDHAAVGADEAGFHRLLGTVPPGDLRDGPLQRRQIGRYDMAHPLGNAERFRVVALRLVQPVLFGVQHADLQVEIPQGEARAGAQQIEPRVLGMQPGGVLHEAKVAVRLPRRVRRKRNQSNLQPASLGFAGVDAFILRNMSAQCTLDMRQDAVEHGGREQGGQGLPDQRIGLCAHPGSVGGVAVQELVVGIETGRHQRDVLRPACEVAVGRGFQCGARCGGHGGRGDDRRRIVSGPPNVTGCSPWGWASAAFSVCKV